MPYATSKIVQNAMPTTPLPCAIAEGFQVSVTYSMFASHKWKFENRKRCFNCKYSPTENSMLAFRSANTVFIDQVGNIRISPKKDGNRIIMQEIILITGQKLVLSSKKH